MDAVVVGAGWAGLGVSYFLRRPACGTACWSAAASARPGGRSAGQFPDESAQRPTVMPGCRYDGPEPEGFMTRDEFVALLEGFAARNRLPVETAAPVVDLTGRRGHPPASIGSPRRTGDARPQRRHRQWRPEPPRRPSPGRVCCRCVLLPSARGRIPPCRATGAWGGACGRLRLFRRTDRRGFDRVRSDRLPRHRPHRPSSRVVTVGATSSFWMQSSGVFDVPRRDLIDPAGRFRQGRWSGRARPSACSR